MSAAPIALRRAVLSAAILLGALAVGAGARADVISGSFSGIASNSSYLGNGGPQSINGSTITGTFDLSSVAGADGSCCGTPGEYALGGGSITLSFDVPALGATFDFSSAASGGFDVIALSDNGTTQKLLLDPDFGDPHSLTSLTLTGPEGSLFTSINDPASIHAGAGVTVQSPVDLDIWYRGNGDVDLTREQINGVPVREPPGWSIVALPLLGLVGWRWRVCRSRGRRAEFVPA